MSDKSFKVKSGLTVPALSTAGIVKTDSSGVISSSATLSISEGGTGQTTAGNALNALLPLQTGNDNKYLQTNGVSVQWNAISVMSNTTVSSNVTLSANTRYFVDTTAARSLTMPSSASVGDEIDIIDASNAAGTNNITLLSNGLKINGSIQDAIINVSGGAAVFLYTGSTYGWRFA